MANLLNRVAQLERRANPEALGMPFIFLSGTDIDVAKSKWEESHKQTLPTHQPIVFFKVIQPSTTPGGDTNAKPTKP